MKNIKLILLFAIGIFMMAATATEAQRITAGGGVGYGSKSEDLNFQVNIYYKLPTLPLRIGGDVGYSKPETNLNVIDSNANIHFMAVDTELFSLYSITGINVLHNRFSIGDITESDTLLGLNLGAGAEVDLGFGRGFGEAKYVVGRDKDDSQMVLGAGVRVNL